MSASGFFLCPVAINSAAQAQQWQAQQLIYMMAFQQAQAVVRPSLIERDLAAVWN